MNTRLLFSTGFFLVLFNFASSLHAQAPEGVIPGQYIVVLKPGVDPAGVAAAHGLVREQTYRSALNGFAGAIPAGRLNALSRDPRVAWVEPDQVVSAFDNPELPTGVRRIGGHLSSVAGIGTGQSVDVDIAIIDTGIQLDHPDLNVFRNVNFARGGKTGDDGNGHGTHVAGTAAASDNGFGVVGVAPGARLWAVRVLDNSGSGTMSGVISGVDYVTQNAREIEVANMSLGCECSSPALDAAIDASVDAGVTYVVAAGNNAKDASTFSPANHPKVITVSAIADFNGKGGGGAPPTCRNDTDDTLADFSNYGPAVDIAAPGVCILSTWKGSSYHTISGTSMASPHVAGAAALFKVAHPTATPAEIKSGLRAAGKAQSDPDFGFTQDRDSIAEPLVYVGEAEAADSGGNNGGGNGSENGEDTVEDVDGEPPVISNVNSRTTHSKNGSFEITWTTNEAATSEVYFPQQGTFTDSVLKTSHRMGFRGTRGVRYEYYVRSVDAAGNPNEAGPFWHQN